MGISQVVKALLFDSNIGGSSPPFPANYCGEMRMGTQKLLYNKLYKGRYLIALYDCNDRLVAVGDNPFQLGIRRPQSFYEQMSRGDMSFYKCKVHLIDCLKVHDDVFKEEDEMFLSELRYVKTRDKEIEEIAKRLGISKRTAYRRLKLGILKEN